MEIIDIFIEVSKGSVFVCCGIIDEVLWQYNLKLVIVYLFGFGQYGIEEYINFLVYNIIVQVFSGYLIQNGDVDQLMFVFLYIVDYFFGLIVIMVVLVVLYKVCEIGKGESIDIVMYEVMLCMGQYFMMDYFNGGEMCLCMSKGKDFYYVGCGLYKCVDGYIVMELVGII